jgi:enterochelin esterase-like enzyme
MKTRQAILFMACVPLFVSLSACSPPKESLPTQTSLPATPTQTATISPSPVPVTPTPAPLTCLTEAGRVEQNVQTYKQDQWVRIGAPALADQLIHSGESTAFIMVFPDDHYWNAPAGAGFGNRLIKDIIPYIDKNFRTLADREHRALGGLSRGGGWTVQLGFEHPELFGSLGLHSPAIFKDNAPFIEKYIQNIPEDSRPRLWFDIGDADMELGSGRLLEEVLTRNNYIHEFHLFTGDHTELYWSAHVEDYLRWYADAWQETAEQ